MRTSRSFAVAVVYALSAIGFFGSLAQAQTTAGTGPVLGQPCNQLRDVVPVGNDVEVIPFLKQKLGSPVDPTTRDQLLKSGLPCQETINAGGDKTLSALDNRQRGFDFYSWLTFIALNSPADGTPIDKSKSGSKVNWEHGNHFKQLLDVMVENPDRNTPVWGDRKIPNECNAQFERLTPEEKNNIMVVKMIEESFNEPFKTGPLIDQQGNYAIFDILMNKQMFEYIALHKLNSKAVQMSDDTAKLKIDFPAGSNPEKDPSDPTKDKPGDPGAIMVKVSWRVLDMERDRERFHTADALVLMPRHNEHSNPPCLRKTLGLVGFHVGHKTKSRLQWIWTSFEHVENVPEQRDVDNKKINKNARYSFYDAKCDKTTCPVNQTPPRPWDPVDVRGLKFHSAFKSQITRTIPLTDATKNMNARFQDLLKNTVWKNYMLLSTQWPSGFPCAQQVAKVDPGPTPNTDFEKQPDMTCAPAPTFLANSTLETYSQGSVPLASSSCMDCHGNAVSHQRRPANAKPEDKYFNQSDFTFMLEKAR